MTEQERGAELQLFFMYFPSLTLAQELASALPVLCLITSGWLTETLQLCCLLNYSSSLTALQEMVWKVNAPGCYHLQPCKLEEHVVERGWTWNGTLYMTITLVGMVSVIANGQHDLLYNLFA